MKSRSLKFLMSAVLLTSGLSTHAQKQAEISDPESQTHQPLITLDVDGATLPELAQFLGLAIHKQIGVSKIYEKYAKDNQLLYTLHATKQPFWLVYEQLHQQNGIFLHVPNPLHGDVINLAPAAAFDPPRQQIHFHAGDFLVVVDAVARPKADSPLQLNWAVIPDPRIHIVKASIASLKVVDESSNTFAAAPGPSPSKVSDFWMLDVNLTDPKAKLGKVAKVDAMLVLELEKKQTFKIHVICPDVPIRQ